MSKLKQLKSLARSAGRVRGKERRRLVDRLVKDLPKLDPFEGHDGFTIWLARFLARLKWLNSKRWD